MTNGLIIISPNEEDKIFQVGGILPGEHGSKILEYLYNNNLDFDDWRCYRCFKKLY